MPPLRIAHLSPTYFSPKSVVGGGERYVVNLAQALDRANGLLGEFSQTIIALGRDPEFFAIGNLPVRVLRNENPSENAMDGISDLLWRELQEFDVVHIHQSLTTFGAYATVVAASLRKPIVLTDLGGGHNPIMVAGRGLDLAQKVVSISQYAHSLIAANYTGDYEILIGPVDTDIFAPQPGIQKNRSSGICVSRIMPHKGIDRIIHALPPSMKLTIVGQVYDQSYYEHLRQISASKQVDFVHDADDERLVYLYNNAGIFLQGSTTKDLNGNFIQKTELMGLTTLEAMSCGLPCIVSNGGSLPEMLPPSDMGRVFNSHDQLVSHLGDYTSGLWPPPDASRAVRDYVVSCYSYQAVGQKLGRLYTEVSTNYAGSGKCAS
jgi:glycosyltransferase involved in cell wall biosynthesis